MPSEMKRLRQLEDENAKLKRIVADLSLHKAMLQDVLSEKLWRLPASANSELDKVWGQRQKRPRKTRRGRGSAQVSLPALTAELKNNRMSVLGYLSMPLF
jgi:hypothetical protein